MLKESSVLYFNRGTSNYIRLIVSVFSLRNHYWGPITLLQEGEIDNRVRELLEKLEVDIQSIPFRDEYVLVRKASLWREMTCRYGMYIDSDTLVRGSILEFFDQIKEWGFVCTWFKYWKTSNGLMQSRIKQWAGIVPELIAPALAYGKAINSGVQGWSTEANILPAYEELTRKGAQAGYLRRVIDEIALQLLLPSHRHILVSPEWNASVKDSDAWKARIIHYHGRKHCLSGNSTCDIWKSYYFEVLSSFPQFADVLSKSWGDRRLRLMRKNVYGKRSDITIVTAANSVYIRELKRNIKRWLDLPGLKQQQFLILVHTECKGFTRRWLRKHPNVQVAPWTYPYPEVSDRECMLAAFIFGVATHVKTEYWMKLDADCRPRRKWWEWPAYNKYSIVSHKWGYTRLKCDPDESTHWFNRLDDAFSPQMPRFAFKLDPSQYRYVSHRRGNRLGLPKRFNSFCHIERTQFTQRIAEYLNENRAGRLPIPSQDTISWYCSWIWQEKVLLTDMRKWFIN